MPTGANSAIFVTRLYSLANRIGLLDKRLFRELFLRSFFIYKRWFEDPFHRLCHRHPELFKGGLILDLGANVGYTASVFARAMSPGSKVLAFEPDPDNIKSLRSVLARLGLADNVSSIEAAVGDHEGEVEFWLNKDHHADHRVVTNSFKEQLSQNEQVRKVKLHAVDSYLNQFEPNKPVVFTKIDVQGYEPLVLNGMIETIEKNPGMKIAFEYSPQSLIDLGFSVDSLSNFFVERNFLLYEIHRDGSLDSIQPKDLEQRTGKRGYIDLLASRDVLK